MSRVSSRSPEELEAAAAFGAGSAHYSLTSDLAKMCLPGEFKDLYRKLAWVDSICFLFLVVGLIGIKPPKIVERPVSQAQDVVPVVYTPPEEQPKVEPEVKQDEPPPENQPMDTPVVAAIVAAVDSPAVAFAVPVQGAVAVASARFATPPPPVSQQAPRFTKFDPNAYGSGNYPKPDYPGFAQRNHYQGTVTLEIRLTEAYQLESVQVVKSSGFPILDEAAMKAVKMWHFAPPLPGKLLLWDCKFELK